MIQKSAAFDKVISLPSVKLQDDGCSEFFVFIFLFDGCSTNEAVEPDK
jgi:hypothetical protein